MSWVDCKCIYWQIILLTMANVQCTHVICTLYSRRYRFISQVVHQCPVPLFRMWPRHIWKQSELNRKQTYRTIYGFLWQDLENISWILSLMLFYHYWIVIVIVNYVVTLRHIIRIIKHLNVNKANVFIWGGNL